MLRPIAAAVLGGALYAQSFEVASVRQHVTLIKDIGVDVSGSRLNARAVHLMELIGFAYELKDYQTTGGPSWAKDVKWDITATAAAERPLERAVARKMMQALLTERFEIQFHYEKRELPIYALVVSKSGVKMKESTNPNGETGLSVSFPRLVATVKADRATTSQLAASLGGHLGLPVFDRTGLTGTYAFKLEWLPVDQLNPESSTPTLFTAVQEQLGLKLESTKQTMDVLVLDSAERPSAN